MRIYHNPKCSKSRQTLALINERNKEVEIIEYLKKPLGFDDLEMILIMLSISPADLVRKNEDIWKENYKGKDLKDDEIIQAMVDHPKLIERLIRKNKFWEDYFFYYHKKYEKNNRKDNIVLKEITYKNGFISRAPDNDERVQNPPRPLSIVVDLYK